MSNPPSPRRLTIAFTAAIASTTLALGVVGASLMGWFAPAPVTEPDLPAVAPIPAPSSSPSPILFVPITPDLPAVAIAPRVEVESPRAHEEREDREDHEDDDD